MSEKTELSIELEAIDKAFAIEGVSLQARDVVKISAYIKAGLEPPERLAPPRPTPLTAKIKMP